MKKLNRVVVLILTLIICFSYSGLHNKLFASTLQPSVLAKSYVVMDAKTGEILFSQNKDKRIYPASTAKLMTALVAVQNGNISDEITIKKEILSGVLSEASQVGLKPNTTYTLDQLLNMLLVDSAADAADTIADAVCGSKAEFLKLMNQKAKELGMNSTSFDNTIGLDYDDGYTKTYSTANDIAILTKEVMKDPTIREIVGKSTYTIYNFNNTSSYKIIKNTNKFLTDQYYPKDKYTITGAKTGWTPAAGNCLATTAVDKNGREIICAFFGNSRLATMYKDIEKLLTYTYANYGSSESVQPENKNDIAGHWAEVQFNDFIKKGYIGGYSDGSLRPNNNITRSEFVKTLNKVFNLTKASGIEFSDTKTHWAKQDIDIAVTNGVCNGKTATEFRPNDNITREEVAVMVSNYKKISDSNIDKISKYADSNKVSSWATSSVEGVLEKGYMGGYSDNTIRPKNNISRAEAVVMLSRIN